MKKLRFLILAAIVLATLVVFSLSANAAVIAQGNCGDNGDNVKYSLDSNGTLTIYGSGKIKDSDMYGGGNAIFGDDWDLKTKVKSIVIKDGITEIGSCTFEDYSEVETVTIADSVTKIGEGAFNYCKKLSSVRLPKYITELAPHVFENCFSLQNIELPSGIKSIGQAAFYRSGLKSVTIPEGVTDIGYGAFMMCEALESVSLPESLTTVDDQAFDSCGKLKSLYLPKNVKQIGHYAFEPVLNIVCDNWVTVNGVTFTKDMKTLIRYDSAKVDTSYTVPDSVKAIVSYAFYKCTNLTSINLNEGLETIYAGAFSGSVNIKELIVPENVTTGVWQTGEACYVKNRGSYGTAFDPFAGMALDSIYICSMEINVVEQVMEYYYFPAKNLYVLKGSVSDMKAQEAIENIYPPVAHGSYDTPAQVHYFIPHTHSYTGEITTFPSCIANGVRTFTCACGDSYTESIPKAEHICDRWYVASPAYVGVNGVESGICTSCGAVATRDIPALPKDRPVFRLVSENTDGGVKVKVMLENNVNGFYNLDFTVKYDSEMLVLKSTDTSESIAKFDILSGDGKVAVFYDDTAFIHSKGNLCTLEFEYADSFVDETEVSITIAMNDDEYTAVNCMVTAPDNSGGKIVTMTIGTKVGCINGRPKLLDAAPIIRNDRTMLPVRFVAEAFGAEVGWDGATSTASIKTDDVEISITIGATTAIVNGEEVTLDSPAFIENSRTYLPVRFVAEKLGASVQWNGRSSTATLTK